MLKIFTFSKLSGISSSIFQNNFVYGQQYIFCSNLLFLKFAFAFKSPNPLKDGKDLFLPVVQLMSVVISPALVPTFLTMSQLILQYQHRLFIGWNRVKLKVDGNNAFFLLAAGTLNVIEISFGFSHHVCYIFPSTFRVKISGRKSKILTVQTRNKVLLHNFCCQVVKTKKNDPYRHTGVTFGYQRAFTKKGKKKFV